MTEQERYLALMTIAFNAAMRDNMAEAAAAVQKIDEEGGPDGAGVVEFLVGLCDTMLAAMNIPQGTVLTPELVPVDGDVTDQDRWAARLICARSEMDEMKFANIVLEVPRDDPHAPWPYVQALLMMSAYNTRVAKAAQS